MFYTFCVFNLEWIIPLEESFDVSNVDVQVQQVGLRVIASLDIYSKFPLDILCSNISLTVLNKKNTTKDDKIKKSKSKSESFTGHSGLVCINYYYSF